MSRRSSGEGSITQRPNGLWQGSLQLAGKRHTVYGKTRLVVSSKLRNLAESARTAGRLPASGTLTLGAFLASWLEQAETRLRSTTLADYRVIISKHVNPHIGHVRLAHLTALHVSHHQTLLAKSLSKRRVRMVHDLLHKALGDAMRWGLVAANVAALVDPPKRTTKELTLWEPQQAAAFVDALSAGNGGHYGPLLVFLLASGCRLAEALGLRWSDVAWEAGSVKIERQLVEVWGQFVEGPPKTKSGVRTVALPEFGMQALRLMKVRQAACRLRQGVAWADTERIFTTDRGTPPSRSNLHRAFATICTALGLPAIRVHDLRHLSLSLLAMSGVPVKVAQQRAGHCSPQVTLRTYLHVLGDADRLAANAMQRIVAVQGNPVSGKQFIEGSEVIS